MEDLALSLFSCVTQSSLALLKGKICSNFPHIFLLLKSQCSYCGWFLTLLSADRDVSYLITPAPFCIFNFFL